MSEGSTKEKIPEFEPPQACVSRVIKPVLPENILLTKDARVAFARAAGIFIFYLTHCANEFSKDSKRQTILASDVMNALRELDFDEFTGPLEEFLEVYRRENETKKGAAKEKRDSKGSAKASSCDAVPGGGGGRGEDEGDKMNEEEDETLEEEEEGDEGDV